MCKYEVIFPGGRDELHSPEQGHFPLKPRFQIVITKKKTKKIKNAILFILDVSMTSQHHNH